MKYLSTKETKFLNKRDEASLNKRDQVPQQKVLRSLDMAYYERQNVNILKNLRYCQETSSGARKWPVRPLGTQASKKASNSRQNSRSMSEEENEDMSFTET